jgi:hypothetical protein
VARLRDGGYTVHGDLDDLLLPPEEGGDGRRLDDVTTDELLAAAEAALVSLSTAQARLFTRFRRAFVEQTGAEPGVRELFGSSARAAGFRLRESALDRAEHNRVLAWAARAYLRRTGG